MMPAISRLMSEPRQPEVDGPTRDEQSVRYSRKFLVLALVALFVASLICLGLLKAFSPLQLGSPSMEVFKAVLQLGVISVAAAAVALLSFNYQFERQREEADRQQGRREQEKNRETKEQETLRKIELLRRTLEYRDDLLRTILGRAVANYSAVKKTRRLVRALGIKKGRTEKTILLKTYDEQMEAINDAQLVFENLQRDVDNSKDAFSKAEWIVENLKKMDGYLGKLVSEYEERRPAASNRLLVSQLQELSDFISFSGTSRFHTEIVKAFHEVQKAIRQDLLNPQFIDLESLVRRPDDYRAKQ